jgi:Plasmid pRiA4b ORF-3-like protein
MRRGGYDRLARPPSRMPTTAVTGIVSRMSFNEPNAVQIRVSLARIEPAIWRRLIVPIGFHLGQLHRVIQAAFGWWDYHLHEFRIGGLSYRDAEVCEPEFEGDARSFDESAVRLLDFDRGEDLRLLYVYDFGDDWEHVVEFERLLALDPKPRTANCIDGARARPPEDVGGVNGYADFLDIIADPENPEHRETKRWAGGHFDPEWFDREMTDRDVRNALRANRRIRLHQPRSKRAGRSP